MMTDSKASLDDLKQIRTIMERSSTFLSLSGFSGMVVGLIAIATSIAIGVLGNGYLLTSETLERVKTDGSLRTSILVVFIVSLAMSVASAFIFSLRKSRRKKLPIFNLVSLSFALHFFMPLLTGGIFIVVLALKGYYDLLLPSMLIFFGLSLVSASKYTLHEIAFLGFCALGLGLLAAVLIPYSLLLWAAGFGVCTIGYGLFLYSKYEK
jgi:hypothetical protein